jgi:hypothetical protein
MQLIAREHGGFACLRGVVAKMLPLRREGGLESLEDAGAPNVAAVKALESLSAFAILG